jgi:hypothetical protein
MTTGDFLSGGGGAVRNWLVLGCEPPKSWLSGVGEGGKAVFIAVSVTVGVAFCYWISFLL